MSETQAAIWRRFATRLVLIVAGAGALLFALLALLDPWGTLPFRSPLPRVPADHSARWAYPELARSQSFDSAIIGNSTSRLFNPAVLEEAVGGHIVNLAMVRALAYEQARLLDVFLAAHPHPRTIQIGLERTWCERGDQIARFGYDPIPEWLYDDSWGGRISNLFSVHAVYTVFRSLSAVLGLSKPEWGRNGYQLIGFDRHPYDPAVALRQIETDLRNDWGRPSSPDPATWHYQGLDWLQQRLDRVPEQTRVFLVFVPIYYRYPDAGTNGAAMMTECRRRVMAMAAKRPNLEVYDMQYPDALTATDSNWWDVLHARPEPMAQATRALADAIEGKPTPLAHKLWPDPAREASAQGVER